MNNNIFLDDEFITVAKWCVTHKQWAGTTPFILAFRLDRVKAEAIYHQLMEHGIIKEIGGYTRPNISPEQLELLIKYYRKEVTSYDELSVYEKKSLLTTLLTEKFVEMNTDRTFSFNYIVEKNGASLGIQYVHDHEADIFDVLSGYLKLKSSGIDSVIVISVHGATEEATAMVNHMQGVFLWDLFQETAGITNEADFEGEIRTIIDKALATVYDDQKKIHELFPSEEQVSLLPVAIDRKGITYSINSSNQQDAVRIVEQINREAKTNRKVKIIENNGAICLFSSVDNCSGDLF